MEEYNNHLNDNSAPRGNFLYHSPILAASSSGYGRTSGGSNVSSDHQQTQMHNNTFPLQSGGECFQSEVHPIVKTENIGSQHLQTFHYHLMRGHQAGVQQQQEQQHGRNENSSTDVEAIKAKIVAHPQYSNLLEAYMDCQKVGASPEMVARLSAAREEFESRQRSSVSSRETGEDPELDQFMEAYCDMLVKYRDELSRPIQEAMDFFRRIETQLNMLCNGAVRIFPSGSSISIYCRIVFPERNDSVGVTSCRPYSTLTRLHVPILNGIRPTGEKEIDNNLVAIKLLSKTLITSGICFGHFIHLGKNHIKSSKRREENSTWRKEEAQFYGSIYKQYDQS